MVGKRAGLKNYVPLSRKFFRHPFWTEKRVYTKAEAWIYLVVHARFEKTPKRHISHGQKFAVNRGEIYASVRQLGQDWNWSIGAVQRFITYLIDEQMLAKRMVGQQAILVLCNYDRYNGGEIDDLPDTVSGGENDTVNDTPEAATGKDLVETLIQEPIQPVEKIWNSSDTVFDTVSDTANDTVSDTAKSTTSEGLEEILIQQPIQEVIQQSIQKVEQKYKERYKKDKNTSYVNSGELTGEEEKESYDSSKCGDKAYVYNFIRRNTPTGYVPYLDLWNLFAAENGFPLVKTMNDDRKKKISVRLKESLFDFPEVLRKAKTSERIREGSWFSFDWIIKNSGNYLKVLEGNYDNKTASKPIKTELSDIAKKAKETQEKQRLQEQKNA